MHPTIKTLAIQLDMPLQGREISRFRAAVAESAGLEDDLFHNHQPDGEVIFRYPLIQYRVRHSKAAIFAIDAGADAVQQWLFRSGGQLKMGEETLPIAINKMSSRDYELKMTKEPRWYYLSRWLPFHPEHYNKWVDAAELKERTAQMENLLTAHILTFARALDWMLPARLEVRVQQIVRMKQMKYHDLPMVGFDIVYTANIDIPAGIALGRAVSRGFGVQYPVHKFDRNDFLSELRLEEELVQE